MTRTKEKTFKNEIKNLKIKIDQIDKEIIKKIEKNSRLSFRKIAQTLEISTGTVSRRFKKLYKNINSNSSSIP